MIAGPLISNGLSFATRVDGSGAPITLVHGVGSSLQSWDDVVEALPTGYELFRFDLRGHGNSDKPPGPYSMEDFSRDLAGLLDARGLERSHIAGFSLGGLIAQDFALRYPQRVDRLVMISAIANRTAEQKAALSLRAHSLESGGATTTIEAALERWFTPEFRAAHPELIEQRIKSTMDNDPAAYAAAYRVFVETDLGAELHRIKAPTLIMTGEHDPGSSALMATFMHQQIPGSKLHIIPRLRHSVLSEAPRLIADWLHRFFSGVLDD